MACLNFETPSNSYCILLYNRGTSNGPSLLCVQQVTFESRILCVQTSQPMLDSFFFSRGVQRYAPSIEFIKPSLHEALKMHDAA